MATHSSETVTILSINGAENENQLIRGKFFHCKYTITARDYVPPVAKALTPTVGTTKPSAMLAVVAVNTGLPFFKALVKLGLLSGSTPFEKKKPSEVIDL